MAGLHIIDNGLFLVDLDLPLTGFRNFISCWIYQRRGKTVIIDPGPASTIPYVLKALKQLNIKSLDLILLTHIHLDHAGGSGHLVERFPDTPVFCHPIAVSHLNNPQKLWQGSLKVLDQIARAYGAPKPVPEKNLFSFEEKPTASVPFRVFETPGHASHHVCYMLDELLFAGEVAGVYLPVKHGYYLRIATPPVFKYSVYRHSLLKAAKIKAKKICFGHYGLRKYNVHLFNLAEAQLELWMDIIKEFARPLNEKDYEDILAVILQKDPSLQQFDLLPADIRERERYFCLNSIKGIHGYILNNAG